MICRRLLLIVAGVVFGNTCVMAQLDDTWQLTVNGQTVQVNSDGSFRIRNISAADTFPADFLSDNALRAIGVRTVNGVTEYAVSDPFQIEQICIVAPCPPNPMVSQASVVENFLITLSPPQFPESITLTSGASFLTIGQTTELTTTGVVAGMPQPVDLTSRCKLTSYQSSNPSIAMIEEIGNCAQQPQAIVRVTAVDLGTVYLTATNNGATAVTRVNVVESIGATNIEGFVRKSDGSPLVGASITTSPDFGVSGLTNSAGLFSLSVPQVPICGESNVVAISASVISGGILYEGQSDFVPIVIGGITDAGLITATQAAETGACCLPGDNGDCVVNLAGQCSLAGGRWWRGLDCFDIGPACPIPTYCLATSNQCYEPSPSPGCSDPLCCAATCAVDDFCCGVAWDSTCVNIAAYVCCFLEGDDVFSAPLIVCNTTTTVCNEVATTVPGDPGFGCNKLGVGEQGIGTQWYLFIAQSTSARIRTCMQFPYGDDSILAAYSGDCSGLTELACSDDVIGCPGGPGLSDLCVTGLVPGEVYYIQIAASSEANRGHYELEIICPAVPACPP
jgi:hypothetical protein